MTSSTDPHHHRRWAILAVLGFAQLMVVLDATIVNIALPSAQADLGFSDEGRQWVITAYALAFGGLLLLGGRLSDIFGRKRMFIVGLLGFSVASAAGGAAGSFGVLVAARAAQGAFGALLAPAALSLLTTTFTDPTERRTAFGIYGAIAGAGGGLGLLLGGMLTEWLSWRWCLYVNLVIAIPVAIAAAGLLHAQVAGVKPRLDLVGAVTATLGLVSLVYGFSHAETDGWGDTVTIAMIAGGIALLGLFVVAETRVAQPLLPMRVVLDRDRGGAYLSVGIVGAGMFGVFLFLTYYLQQTLGFTPIQSGLSFLPMIGAIIISSTVSTTQLLGRVGPRPLVPTGMLLAAGAMVWLTGVEVDSSYATAVLPALIVAGLGFGLIMAPSMASATLGVRPTDAGVASAMVNTTQQVGGSLGTALLSTFAATAASDFAASRAPSAELAAQAAVHGYVTAFWWSAGIFLLGAVVSALVLRSGVQEADPTAEPVLAH